MDLRNSNSNKQLKNNHNDIRFQINDWQCYNENTEDEEEYGEEQYEGEEFTDNDPLETLQDTEVSAKEEKKR